MSTLPAIETAEDALLAAQIADAEVEKTLAQDEQAVNNIVEELSQTTQPTTIQLNKLVAAQAKVADDLAEKALSDAAIEAAQTDLATAFGAATGVPLAEAVGLTLNLKQDYKNDWTETTRKDWKKDWI
jgi:hypothetical protein